MVLNKRNTVKPGNSDVVIQRSERVKSWKLRPAMGFETYSSRHYEEQL